ncbi:Rnasel [Symbiodinium necroappetens]|uniref:Rnasel protein n=1 Tax=Symbiodinium necroappetens TaxID=1628268 RepID=A0A812ZY20_9DINO|nr:Rnasel [Symbiodinium necroappetens]
MLSTKFWICLALIPILQSLRPEIAEHGLKCTVPGSRPWDDGCMCDTHLGPGCGPLQGKKEFYPADVPKSSDCKCVTPMESREESRKYGVYNITNDAVRFCAGLFTMVEKDIPSDSRAYQVHHSMKNTINAALRHPEVETICQTALTGDVSTQTADEELVHWQKAQTPLPTSETRVVQVMGRQTAETWRVLLKSVCHDECHELVDMMKNTSDFIAARVAVHGDSIPAKCSNLVVSKVEAEILGCCAKSCGWDGKAQTCRYWPFLNQEEQDGWNERCCTEDTILRMSSREVMCNSVKPEAERKKLEEHDPTQAVEPRDAQLVSQDFKPSLLQTAKLQDKETSGVGDCSDLHKACPKDDQKMHMKHCKEKEAGEWNYMASERHFMLSEVDCVTEIDNIEKTSPEKCLSKLKENQGMRSASWQSGTCPLVNASCAEASQYDKDVQNDFLDAAQVVLFKLAAR